MQTETEKVVHIPSQVKVDKSNKVSRAIEYILYNSRWLLSLMYIAMPIPLALYVLKYLQEIYHMCMEFSHSSEETLLLATLAIVDISMIGNLIYVIMVGGFSIFVSEIDIDLLKDKPKWLENINAGTLKIKMGQSLIGVSSIHLLKAFIEAHDWTWIDLSKLIAIHGVFILSTIAFTWVDAKSHSKHSEEH